MANPSSSTDTLNILDTPSLDLFGVNSDVSRSGAGWSVLPDDGGSVAVVSSAVMGRSPRRLSAVVAVVRSRAGMFLVFPLDTQKIAT